LGKINGSTKTSAKESLGLYELKQHKPLFDEDVHGFWIEGLRPKCNDYSTQTKALSII